jgi:hypothetical protein
MVATIARVGSGHVSGLLGGLHGGFFGGFGSGLLNSGRFFFGSITTSIAITSVAGTCFGSGDIPLLVINHNLVERDISSLVELGRKSFRGHLILDIVGTVLSDSGYTNDQAKVTFVLAGADSDINVTTGTGSVGKTIEQCLLLFVIEVTNAVSLESQEERIRERATNGSGGWGGRRRGGCLRRRGRDFFEVSTNGPFFDELHCTVFFSGGSLISRGFFGDGGVIVGGGFFGDGGVIVGGGFFGGRGLDHFNRCSSGSIISLKVGVERVARQH